jgi:hypothetical protein
MCRDIIEIIIKLLHIFAVVALVIAQAEQSFFQYFIFSIPEGNGKTEILEEIGNSSQSIFSPEVGAAMRMIEWKVIPCVIVQTIIFPNGGPLAFAEIGAPLFQGYFFRGID